MSYSARRRRAAARDTASIAPPESDDSTSTSPAVEDLVLPFAFRALDDVGDDQRFSTWMQVDPSCRGPEPRPPWVVTSQAAIDTDLGVLKTGKEADVHLVERAVPDGHDPGDGGRRALMAAKMYRTPEHMSFHRSAQYTEGRVVRRSRDARALAGTSAYGRAVAAGQWAIAEWSGLRALWSAGIAVPYPVQIDGTEILMEYIEVDGDPAPRLAQSRPSPDLLSFYLEQVRQAMIGMARLGYVHGDLSAYNLLAANDRIVLIDVPQIIDIAANPNSYQFLMRDCRNVCSWFAGRGLTGDRVDDGALFAEVISAAY